MKEFESDEGVIIYSEDTGFHTHAWMANGKSWFLRPEDMGKEPEVLAAEITEAEKRNMYRCSSCGKDLHKDAVAGWPLFCGVACYECEQKHLESRKQEIANGHVCSYCHKPYSQCCC